MARCIGYTSRLTQTHNARAHTHTCILIYIRLLIIIKLSFPSYNSKHIIYLYPSVAYNYMIKAYRGLLLGLYLIMNLYMYIYIYMCVMCVYYVYIRREREGARISRLLDALMPFVL